MEIIVFPVKDTTIEYEVTKTCLELTKISRTYMSIITNMN
jgi:hypothetical protein